MNGLSWTTWVGTVMGLSLLLASGAREAGGFAYEVKPGHPRIFVSAEDVPALVKRCSPGGPAAEQYGALKQWIDGFLSRQEAMNGSGLPGLCVVYQVEKGLGHDTAKYVDYLVNGLWGTDGKGGGSKLNPGRQWTTDGWTTALAVNMGGVGYWFGWEALCYDWFYKDLTPEQRTRYGNILGQWLLFQGLGRGPMKSAEIVLVPGVDNFWYNQTWGGCGGYAFGSFYARQAVGPKTLVALALFGEETEHKQDAQVFLTSLEKQLCEGFLPALNARGGIPTEGPNHGTGQMLSVAMALEALRTAGGLDLFPMFDRHGLLAETPLWYAYTTLPQNGSMAPIDDLDWGPKWWRRIGEGALAMPLIARRYAQPVAQQYALTQRLGAGDAWVSALWLDPQAKATEFKQLPLAYHFPGCGHVYMRSAWDDPDATWAYFGAGDRIVYAWGSDDEGEFQIFKGGLLASKKSRGAAILHNVVMVYDPDGKAKNHGGFRDLNADPAAGKAPLAAGRIVAYESKPEYTYACAELARAYGADRVQAYRRHFLYLRGEPECFVVYDHLRLARPELKATWLMYVMNEPIFALGDRDEPVGSIYVTTYSADDNPKKNATQGFPFQSSGFGVMMVRVLLTVNVTLRGDQKWGNPHEADPKMTLEADADTPAWRIEEESAADAEAGEFLNVLCPQLVPEARAAEAVRGQGLVFPTAELTGKDDAHVQLRIRSATGGWEVELARTPEAAGSVKHLGPDGKTVTFSGALTGKVEENGDIPGYSWNPTKAPR
jgi:hypothetical protein